jgi:transcriptional regulator with XRE-family HTH domain
MRIGEVLRSWRRIKDVGVREAGQQIGVSHGTISRIERGEQIDAATMMKLLNWLFTVSNGGGTPTERRKRR